MDGDRRIKQLQQLMAQSNNATDRGRGLNRFEQAMRTRGDPTGISQAPERTTMSYDYGYTGNAFSGGTLQPSDMQSFASEYMRPRHAPFMNQLSQRSVQAQFAQQQQQQQQQHQNQHHHHHHHQQAHQQHQHQHQHQSQNVSSQLHQTSPNSTHHLNRRRAAAESIPLVPYDSAMLYSFSQQQSATHGSFDEVPQYSTRQSAGMDALSHQIAIPQYFSDESAGTGIPGLSPYLNAISYNEPDSMARSSAGQSFPNVLAEYTPMEGEPSTHLDPQPVQSSALEQSQAQIDPHVKSADDQFEHPEYQRALCSTLDQIRAGRLVDASRSMVEISEWLVTNARDLGLLSDNHKQHSRRLQFWNDFNICWLALCQKQKNLTQDIITTGHQASSTTLLSRDRMEEIGKDLIHFCDQLEQHGLVDYQMGIWEEEILSVLGQCLDLIVDKPELLRIPATPEPALATQRS
ncbi:Uncharacterized protein PECH_001665 [Penicillium ucsense]|uniref:Uncharacterized protein n=1 Tax=Penicillium ucsense TaxID=2839758 RepID=A0A8J8WE97_9EURO|nr:Uncharacterized protein PECM_002313 [Penicillium ucsense]KAF7732424.1 Uncharacterized protein PECH_001665 [Penicillium ucsense]